MITLIADSTDGTALRSALDSAREKLGVPEAVIYNVAIIQADRIDTLSVQTHRNAWAVNVVGAIVATAHTAPDMAQRGGGSFIITGGIPKPKPE